MIKETITPERARRFYDWLGARHDIGERYEREAKNRALALLDCSPGHWVLNAGVGTGKEQQQLHALSTASGLVCGCDLSQTMLHISRDRNPHSLLYAGDVRHIPFPAHTFDRLFCSYVLDLLPLAVIPAVLSEFRRVVKTDGRLVLVSLTEGVNRASKIVVGLWKTAYHIHPLTCGGCRPLQLANLVAAAGFHSLQREVIVQIGVPSEVITALA